MKRMCMAMFVLCAHAALADFSADTLAFYPFADKAVGETAETDDVITNAVSSSGTYNGTVKRLKTAGENYGTLTFERFPYPYVYSDWSCTNLLTAEAQSIHIKSNGLARGGAEVSINKIAEKLYEDRNDKDYTIELFWRDNVTWTYETAFSYSGLADHNFYYGYNNTTWIRLNFTSTLLDYGASICDGLWHHLAVIYDHETKKITMVGDYSLVSSTEFTETGTVASPYFILGSNQAENNMIEDVEFSCLRVTQRKLETSEFMVAYDVPVGNGNTVFHWGFDGVNGSNIGTIADRSESSVDWDVMNTQYLFAHGSHSVRAGEVFLGSGTAAACTNPAYRVEVGRRNSVLMSGETVVAKTNLASGELLATAHEAYPYMSYGYGFEWSTNRWLPVAGALTAECLVKLNADNWQHKVIDVNVAASSERWYAVLMGFSYEAGGDWNSFRQYGAFSVRAAPGSDGTTAFWLYYTYYDGEHVPHGAFKKSSWTMSNSVFGQSYHHVAVTYDPDNLKLRLYVDYEERLSVDLLGELAIDASPSMQFGAGFQICAFDGRYDEVRLSRGVLDVSDFLRMEKPELGFSIIFR